MIKIYDTMTRNMREFVPIKDGKVKMYVCGPTVYNYIHVGNARSAIAFDTIRRYLEYRGYEVAYISNFTDVDDKIINRAKEEGIVHDALKTIDGQVLRFFFATQHYRKPINFTEKAVRDAEINLKYLKNTYEQPFTGAVGLGELQAFKDKFIAEMDEDFNTANGISVVFEMARWINSGNYDASVKETLAAMLEVFGVVFVEEVLDEEIEALIQKRQEARATRDFKTADQIRDQLATQGIKLLDTKEGTRWQRIHEPQNS